jgi:hypothetical protein
MPSLPQEIRVGTFDLAPYTNGHPSSFRSARPGGAAWVLLIGDRAEIVRSQGRTVVEAIQCALGVKPDGWWGPRTMEALRYALSARGVSPDWIRDGAITEEVLQAALWVAFTGTTERPSSNMADVVLPRGTLLPVWMRPPPVDGEYHGLVWSGVLPTSTTQLPAASTHPQYGRPLCAPAPASSPQASGRVYVLDPGVDVPAGASLPGTTTPLRPIFANQGVVDGGGGSDSPTITLAVGGAALVALGLLGVWIFDEPSDPTHRANPRRDAEGDAISARQDALNALRRRKYRSMPPKLSARGSFELRALPHHYPADYPTRNVSGMPPADQLTPWAPLDLKDVSRASAPKWKAMLESHGRLVPRFDSYADAIGSTFYDRPQPVVVEVMPDGQVKYAVLEGDLAFYMDHVGGFGRDRRGAELLVAELMSPGRDSRWDDERRYRAEDLLARYVQA